MAHKNADAAYLKRIYVHFSFTRLSFEDFNRAPGEALITSKKLESNYDIFFDEKYSALPTYLTETDIKFLIDNQCVIGSHTTNHKLLSNCTDQDIEETLHAFSETKAKLDAGAYRVEMIPDMAEVK
jgi:hypothetical protein